MFFIVFGISGVIALKSSFFPLIDSKFISINAIYPGASPQEVEEGVIYKIEENLRCSMIIPIIKLFLSFNNNFHLHIVMRFTTNFIT